MRRQFALPAALAAAAALVGAAGTAFAAGQGHHTVSGKVQSVSQVKGRVKIDGHAFSIAPDLLGPMTALNGHSHVTLKVADGKIVGILRPSDGANLNAGTVTAITSTTITIGTTTYTLDANAAIRYHDFQLVWSQVPVGSPATVALDSSGNVSSVWLQADANLPTGSVVSGTVTQVSTSSITIGGYTLAVSSNVVVKSGDQTVSYSTVLPNATAVVHLDNTGTVDVIELGPIEDHGDHGTVRGTVSQDTASSITIGGTTYQYASNVNIRYDHYTLTPTQIPIGSTAALRLNSAGQVTEVKLSQDANLPHEQHVTGTVSAVSGTSITIGTYNLSLAPSIDVTYYGAAGLTNTVTTGETASARLNGSGQVSVLDIGTPPASKDSAHHH